jgi:GNAT superfamily N-acetyltransferase
VDDQLTPAAATSVVARRDDGVEISLDPARLDVDAVTTWLADESYWATGRPRDVVERSIAGSLCFGVYAGPAADAPQVALARVVTDGTTFAWVCDVFVDTGWRGRGIGKWLMRVVVEDLFERRGIERLVLATRDAHAIYDQAGFEPLAVPSRWMEIDRRATRLPGPADEPTAAGN